jgi:hypothetical protein
MLSLAERLALLPLEPFVAAGAMVKEFYRRRSLGEERSGNYGQRKAIKRELARELVLRDDIGE